MHKNIKGSGLETECKKECNQLAKDLKRFCDLNVENENENKLNKKNFLKQKNLNKLNELNNNEMKER